MFNNYINKYDFLTILKGGPKMFLKIAKQITKKHQNKVKDAWVHTEYPENNWWDVPEIRYRWNRLITGDRDIEYYEYISEKYFANRENLSGLSLGCGTGHRELKWIDQGKFNSIEAIDLSKPRIEKARKEAQAKGYDNLIDYRVGDIYKIELAESFYDAVFVEGSLHHFSPLKKILQRINFSLKPEGYLIVNEFVGPTRFQWTEKQIEVINGLLSIFPCKYKELLGNTNKQKSNIFRPSKLRMIVDDPSEVVESSNILPYLHEIFEIVEIREYGGTLLMELFSEIAHNFVSSEPEIKRWLKICFEIEDLLLAEKEISSDFVFAVCKKQSSELNN